MEKFEEEEGIGGKVGERRMNRRRGEKVKKQINRRKEKLKMIREKEVFEGGRNYMNSMKRTNCIEKYTKNYFSLVPI